MPGRDAVPSLLVRRRLTRVIAEIVRSQMTEYLATLAPLLRPRLVLGDYVEDGSKESTRRSEKAYKDLVALYESVASAKPFNLPRELQLPLRVSGTSGLEITAVDTPHAIESGSENRTITVRSPLLWTLTYSGFAPGRLPDLLKAKLRVGDELTHFVLSYLLLHIVVEHSPGLTSMLRALHFPVTTTTLPDFGPLPITRIGVAISTMRPSDDIILESAELTGMDAFEEVVNLDDLSNLSDPLKERLREALREHAPDVTIR
ncbi:MAG TPA: hypothetical protein VGL62_01530 [Vicinamibacterales bacterium]|jgi:hypothetical protein